MHPGGETGVLELHSDFPPSRIFYIRMRCGIEGKRERGRQHEKGKVEKRKTDFREKAVWLGIVLPVFCCWAWEPSGCGRRWKGATFMQEAAEAGNFQAAERAASVMPDFYRDTATLRKYIQARGVSLKTATMREQTWAFSELRTTIWMQKRGYRKQICLGRSTAQRKGI